MSESALHTIQTASLAAFAVLIVLAAILGWCGLEADALASARGAAFCLVVVVVAGVVDAHE